MLAQCSMSLEDVPLRPRAQAARRQIAPHSNQTLGQRAAPQTRNWLLTMPQTT